MGLKRSIKIKSSIIATESALDVKRAAMKETTPAVMPLALTDGVGVLTIEKKIISIPVHFGQNNQ